MYLIKTPNEPDTNTTITDVTQPLSAPMVSFHALN